MSAVWRIADTPADYAAFGDICREYVAWCRGRYADNPAFVKDVFGHQALDLELEVLAAKYGPPHGRTMLAFIDGQAVAGGAYRRLSNDACELKRLFVSDRAKGQGLGRRLSQALFDLARQDGYDVMRLDTARRMIEAQALYAGLGFEPIAPYLDYPAHIAPEIVFMQKVLERP